MRVFTFVFLWVYVKRSQCIAVLMLCCVGVKCSLCGITNSPSDLPQAIQTNDTQMTIRIINTHTIRSPFLRHFTWRALNTHAHRHYSFTVPPTLHVSSLSHNKSITNTQHSHTEILHTVTGVRFGCNAHTHHTHTPFGPRSDHIRCIFCPLTLHVESANMHLNPLLFAFGTIYYLFKQPVSVLLLITRWETRAIEFLSASCRVCGCSLVLAHCVFRGFVARNTTKLAANVFFGPFSTNKLGSLKWNWHSVRTFWPHLPNNGLPA